MAVDVSSFTDTDIINGTLSHTVTITPATEISSVTYSVENSTLSNEVSVDTIGYTAEDIETGTQVTLNPHILRHDPASTGSADIVMTITDIYGRSVNVTDSVSIMTITTSGLPTSAKFGNINTADTRSGLRSNVYNLSLYMTITPMGYINGTETNIRNKFAGRLASGYFAFRSEFINNGEFVVSSTPNKIPTMSGGNSYILMQSILNYINFPVAKLTNYLPASWNEASIFDNMQSNTKFKYKLNDSYLKLYVYSSFVRGWDDRDYIIFASNSSTNLSIDANYQTAGNGNNFTVSTSNLTGSGLKGAVLDSTTMPEADYIGGYAIPKISATRFQIYDTATSQSTQYNDSDYGVVYSSSDSNSSDNTVTTDVYMYTDSLASIATSADRVIKNRSYILVTDPQLNDNAGTSNKPYIGLRLAGTITFTQS